MHMKIIGFVFGLVLTLVQAVQGQTADDYVAQGRSFLTVSNLSGANNCFSNALVLAPNHPTANALRAVTRLLVLPNDPAVKLFLDRLGFSSSGRDLYNWTATQTLDDQNLPIAANDLNAKEAAAQLRTNVLPQIIAAEANLAKITEVNFTMTLLASETKTIDVTLDYGDILMVRAMLLGAEYVCYTTHSWNWDAQITAIRGLYTNDQLTAERLYKDYPSLLAYDNANELHLARVAFEQAVDRYLEASQWIRNRSTTAIFLFNCDTNQFEREANFRSTLVDIKSSLTDYVTLTVNSSYTIFARPLFDGTKTIRSLLPDLKGNGFVLGTPSDLTFGNMIFGLSRENVENSFAKVLDPVPVLSRPAPVAGQGIQFPIRV